MSLDCICFVFIEFTVNRGGQSAERTIPPLSAFLQTPWPTGHLMDEKDVIYEGNVIYGAGRHL